MTEIYEQLSRRLKILHVIPALALSTGGPAISVTNLALALQDRGHDVKVLTTDAATASQAKNARGGVNFDELPPAAAKLDLTLCRLRHPYRIAYSPMLGRQLRLNVKDYEIIHIHSLNLYPQFAAWRASINSQIPYIISPRGALDPWILGRSKFRKRATDVLWQRRMLNGAAAFHLTTDEERLLIEPLHLKPRCFVVPNGINVSLFRTPPERRAFRDKFLDGFAGPLVINHGRIDVKKGLDILIAAIAIAKASVPDLRLALIGPDEYNLGQELRKQAAALGIAEAVTLIGPLYDEDLRGALASADIWSLPSHSENFGVAVAEAMAAGLPIVVSEHVNLAPEAAKEKALIIADNNHECVAEALSNLFLNPTLRGELGDQAKMYANRFDWDTVANEFESMYSTVVALKE